jgi:hypothetical protein
MDKQIVSANDGNSSMVFPTQMRNNLRMVDGIPAGMNPALMQTVINPRTSKKFAD